jgi:hypothetical protein
MNLCHNLNDFEYAFLNSEHKFDINEHISRAASSKNSSERSSRRDLSNTDGPIIARTGDLSEDVHGHPERREVAIRATLRECLHPARAPAHLPLTLLHVSATIQASPPLAPELPRKTPACRPCSALLAHAHALLAACG